MKVALINGSPKTRDSSSGYMLKELYSFLKEDCTTISKYHFKTFELTIEEMEQIKKSDVLVFAFPLYTDGVPSHLLNCLIQLEECLGKLYEKKIAVYALVNSGFYEGIQNELAIEIIENWCLKTGLTWGQGLGIGGGQMLSTLKNVPIGQGPKKDLGKAFKQFSNNILKTRLGGNIFIEPNFPRFAYKLAGEMNWRKAIRANGLKRKDLFKKINVSK